MTAKTYHHGNLSEALLDAAEQLLPARGAEALTLREVAREAGVSHGAPYHHFGSREALLAAIAERGFEGLTAAMSSASGATPRNQLIGICEAYVSFAIKHPTRFRLMFGPLLAQKEPYPELQKAGQASFAVLLQAAEKVNHAEALPLALAGWSLAHGLAHLAIHAVLDSLPVPVPPGEVLARQLAQWLLDSKTAPPDKRSRKPRTTPTPPTTSRSKKKAPSAL
ncbi:MAG TPA: TetR/AcrR family transcriptional regulator [Polaromonas sp.]|uniref:TetR/AcrR family transcriptional regulator n=1 Tax=Polaromonas sp. TaxID=1869339 RepID=UPI002D65727F|nr:TetR/AcrR family transcriptional regulator [Polaromonas sp.]HYW57508.1 TetR/AcrR family transcriptional regulator [Polaromonas sp.]